ncbi:uncharacterized protein [Lolium perenne]|uniref:uncharacterized protein isoform X2 n=1 Tax=Lolium perenne TaxID=4522 RepID=UPI003A997BBF
MHVLLVSYPDPMAEPVGPYRFQMIRQHQDPQAASPGVYHRFRALIPPAHLPDSWHHPDPCRQVMRVGTIPGVSALLGPEIRPIWTLGLICFAGLVTLAGQCNIFQAMDHVMVVVARKKAVKAMQEERDLRKFASVIVSCQNASRKL